MFGWVVVALRMNIDKRLASIVNSILQPTQIILVDISCKLLDRLALLLWKRAKTKLLL